jgi:hypothetical protein
MHKRANCHITSICKKGQSARDHCCNSESRHWAVLNSTLNCPAGTGKTALVRDKLRSLDADQTMYYTINMNSQLDGPSMQSILEAPLEKKAGASTGPIYI